MTDDKHKKLFTPENFKKADAAMREELGKIKIIPDSPYSGWYEARLNELKNENAALKSELELSRSAHRAMSESVSEMKAQLEDYKILVEGLLDKNKSLLSVVLTLDPCIDFVAVFDGSWLARRQGKKR